MNAITDEHWLRVALTLAEQAEQQNEVPVGSVVVLQDRVVGTGYNQPISQHDPTAHAEIIALRQAANTLQNYRLNGATLYVTLEPCAMCCGAMVHARIKRLVFGAFDSKTGAVVSVIKLLDQPYLNHRIEYQGGILSEECGQGLRNFFQRKR